MASELPEKTEITDLVTLGERQRALYKTIRASMDRHVRAAIAPLQARKQAMVDALLDGEASGPLAFDEDDLAMLFGSC